MAIILLAILQVSCAKEDQDHRPHPEWHSLNGASQRESGYEMVECAGDGVSPAELTRLFDIARYPYVVETHPKGAQEAQIVFINLQESNKIPKDIRRNYMFFRNKMLCEFYVNNWPFPGPKPKLIDKTSYE